MVISTDTSSSIFTLLPKTNIVLATLFFFFEARVYYCDAGKVLSKFIEGRCLDISVSPGCVVYDVLTDAETEQNIHLITSAPAPVPFKVSE